MATTTFVAMSVLTVGAALPAMADVRQSRTFGYTGTPQAFTVPLGVFTVDFDVAGAQGGAASPWTDPVAAGGLGGRVTGTLPVTPGEVLTIVVGGRGDNGYLVPTSGTSAGGYNGGGNGGTGGDTNGNAGGGGGASDIRSGGSALVDRVVVAGGGGGGTPPILGGADGANGGAAGGVTGSDGTNARARADLVGKGATQLGGGAGAAGPGVAAGGSGGLGYGGAGGSSAFYGNGEGGGGGGGYYGGGGGGSQYDAIDGGYYWGGGGGGGGSSYAGPRTVGVLGLAGQRSGNGVVILTWTGLNAVSGMPSSDCTTSTIVDATTAGVYTMLRVQAAGPGTVWVCFRVDAGSVGRVGGKVVISTAAGVGALPQVDGAATSCSSTVGNIVPGLHPVARGTVGDGLLGYLLDTYATTGEAWVCLSVSVASVALDVRIVVPVTTVTLPGVAVLWDGDSTFV